MILLFYNLRLSVSSTSYCDICSIVFPENVYIFFQSYKVSIASIPANCKIYKKTKQNKNENKKRENVASRSRARTEHARVCH